MFRRLSASLASILLLSSISQSAAALALTDVGSTRYSEAFAYLGQKNAVQGYNDGTGRPNSRLNRAEAIKVLLLAQEKSKMRAEWYKSHLSSIPLFLDYTQQDWFAPYVEAGFEADIIEGYPDRTFRPGASLKTEEAIALVLRAYGMQPAQSTDGTWYGGYIQAALQKNIVYGGEHLTIGFPITRGQFFDIVYRMDSVQAQKLTAFVDTTPPPSGTTSPIGTVPADMIQYASQKDFAISIPELGINDLTVTHPSDALSSTGLLSVLKSGVGHLFSLPGRGGKVMIYGHSSSYSWDVSNYTKIFTKVNQLQSGDRVYVTYQGKLYVYQVTKQEQIAATDVSPFQGKGEELILYTCWPVGTAKYRLIVHASPVTTVALR